MACSPASAAGVHLAATRALGVGSGRGNYHPANTIGTVRIVLLVAACAAVGACAGALAPQVVYRLAVPMDDPPRGDCPRCRAVLRTGWRGWIRVDGRCPACRARLVDHWWVYPAIAAAGFAALGWRLPTRHAADVALLAAWLLLAATGVVLAGVDLRVRRLPRPVLAATAAGIAPLVAVAAACARDPGLAVRAVVTAVALGGAYLVLALIGPGLVGMGDVYLAALLGLLLGTGPTMGILAGAIAPYLLAGPITAARLAVHHAERRSQTAFGPYLIAGTVLAKVVIPL